MDKIVENLVLVGGTIDFVVWHEFIVMPNHMHGIIGINRECQWDRRDLSKRQGAIVGTGRDLSGIIE